jgi:hypothetical protein
MPANGRCQCFLSLTPPTDRTSWIPSSDPEPPAQEVTVVVLHEQDPRILRKVRVRGGWHTRGAAASLQDITPPEPWENVGLCWAGNEHPVVAAPDAQP